MKKQLLLLTLTMLSLGAFAQSFQWAKRMGGSAIDIGMSIATDDSGNVYTTGYFSGTADFDPGVGTYNISAIGSRDIFISKIDANGNFVWVKTIGGTDINFSISIALDKTGNIYTTGYFQGTTDFNPGIGTYNLTSTTTSSYDIFISKLDNSGNFIWAKKMGGASYDLAYSLALDTTGSVYITGYFQGTADFNPGTGVYNMTSHGDYDIFIAKLNSSGNFVWAKVIGGTGIDLGSSIAIDDSGYVYITGTFRGIVDFDPSPSIQNLTCNGFIDVFILKLNSLGNYVWAKNIGGIDDDEGLKLILDRWKNVYIVGFFKGSVDFDPGSGTTILTSVGSIDGFVLKLNSLGNFVWAKNVGGIGDDYIGTSAIDAFGNICFAGNFQDTVDFDPGVNIYNITASGIYDRFIFSLDTASNFLWARSMSGTYSDNHIYSICIDTLSNIYTTGYFADTADFDPGAGISNLISDGIYDIYISKLSKQCTSLPNVGYLISPSGTICAGNSVTLNGTGASTYIWSNGVINGVPFVPSTSASYTVTGTDINGCTGMSTTTTITVNAIPPTTITTTNNVICGTGSSVLTASAGANYQWYKNNVLLIGDTTQNYTATATGNYKAAITNSCGTFNSNTIQITKYSLPTITLTTSGPTSFCSGGSVTITASSDAGINAAYQWYSGTAIIAGATASSITTNSAGSYKVRVTNTLSGCFKTSSVITVTISTPIATVSASGPLIFCAGGNVVLSANAGLSYLWSTGATTSSITVTASGSYNVTVTIATGCTATSATTIVTVSPLPTITASDTIICSPSSLLLVASAGTSYQWYKNNLPISGAIYQTYSATLGGSYKAVITTNCGAITSNTINITLYNKPTITLTTSGPTSFCSGGSVTINAASDAGANATYQWYLNSTQIVSANTSSYTATASGTYKVIVTNSLSGCTRVSSGVIVKILDPTSSINASGPLTFCAGGSVLFTAATNAGTGATYQWYKSVNAISGATNNSYTAIAAGAYKVRVTNTSGCTKLSTGKNVTINCRLGNDGHIGLIAVIPNPNTGSFTFEYAGLNTEENGIATVQLYSSIGQNVYEFKIDVKDGYVSEELNLKGIVPKGIYLLKMNFNNQVYNSKVMIQ